MTYEIIFEIVEHVATISERENGWTQELNLVRWNGGEPKWDLREWNSAHDRMSRGTVLTESEFAKIVDAYNRRNKK